MTNYRWSTLVILHYKTIKIMPPCSAINKMNPTQAIDHYLNMTRELYYCHIFQWRPLSQAGMGGPNVFKTKLSSSSNCIVGTSVCKIRE